MSGPVCYACGADLEHADVPKCGACGTVLAMGSSEPPRISALLWALAESEDPGERAASAEALGERGIRAARAASQLIRAVRSDDDVAVRERAAEALGRIEARRPKARATLREALNADPSGAVRAAAAGALGMVGGKEEAAELVGRLAEETDPEARWLIVWALGSLGHAAGDAEETLAAMVTDDASSWVRGQAAWALGRIGATGRSGLILQALRSKPNAEAKLPFALGLLWLEGRGGSGEAAVRQLAKAGAIDWELVDDDSRAEFAELWRDLALTD